MNASNQLHGFLPDMMFSSDEIQLAKTLKAQGLSWEPTVGHYVFDATSHCRYPSPFQERVYFILNHAYFMRDVGGEDRFQEIMVWLPTWEQSRAILRDAGVSDQDVVSHLQKTDAFESGQERMQLYRMIQSRVLIPAA